MMVDSHVPEAEAVKQCKDIKCPKHNMSARRELSDTDPMPFGRKHGPNGDDPRMMQDVPASYLHWLWCNGINDEKDSMVGDYIRKNLSALKKEHPDGIWE